MKWTHDALWSKAKVYAARALSERRDSPLFPLWATVAMEFLARALLAKIHPALLADPQKGDNVLYACSVGSVTKPRSVPAKTVFLRCQAIVDGFTQQEFGFVMALVEMRNEELHSGGASYEDYSTALWLADYYRITKILLDYQQHTLEEFLGTAEAVVAGQMIEAAQQEQRAEILKEIHGRKVALAQLDGAEIALRQSQQEMEIKILAHDHKTVACPACGSQCAVTGSVVRTSEPRLENDLILWERTVLATHMQCSVCELELRGHEALHVAGIGGQFTVEDAADPRDYYALEFDPADYYGEEYMNE